MKKLVALFVLLVGLTNTPGLNGEDGAFGSSENNLEKKVGRTELDRVYSAVVRVSHASGIGTGFVSFVTDREIWVNTNSHVVGAEKIVKVEFFHDNRPYPVEGTVRANFFSDRPDDFAIVVVDRDNVPFDVPVLKMGARDAKPGVDALIISAGCPNGRWVFGWKGFVNAYNRSVCEFTPASIPGMSGSPLCEVIDGEVVVTGVVTYLLKYNDELGRDASRGGAIPISHFYDALLRIEPTAYNDESGIPENAIPLAQATANTDVFVRYIFNNETVCQLTRPYVDSMKAKGICFEEHPFTAEIRDAWQVKNTPTFIIMRRDADEEIGRVVGLMPETQSLVENCVAKAKTLKAGAPTPQIVEVAYQPPPESEPCSPETQDGTESLITVNDFDIPALREDIEKKEEKKSESPAQNQDGQVFAEIVPETSYPAPLPATQNETSFRRRNHNELDCEGFLDFHLRDRRQDGNPQEPKVSPETPTTPERKKTGPLNRFLDNKTQEAFDAINSLIDERLQEIKASIEANARTLVAQVFWLTVAAGLTASLITLLLAKAVFPIIKWILQKIFKGIRDAKFIQAFNAALQTTTQNEPEPVIKPTVKKKTSKNGTNVKK